MPTTKNRRKTRKGQDKKDRQNRLEALIRDKPLAYGNNNRRKHPQDPTWLKDLLGT